MKKAKECANDRYDALGAVRDDLESAIRDCNDCFADEIISVLESIQEALVDLNGVMQCVGEEADEESERALDEMNDYYVQSR